MAGSKNDEPKKLSKEEMETLWHSTSHVLASAVKRLWPEIKLAIGPSIEEGFYYDFEKSKPFSEEDLRKIEEEMKKIIDENLKFEKIVMSRKEAEELLNRNNEKYKLEMLKEIPEGEEITFYKHGDFMDMCRGPHVNYTKKIKAVRLTNSTTAYWRGDSKRDVLQRVYGVSFSNKTELEEYISRVEDAKLRDHNKLGKQLDLFIYSDAVGKGLPLLPPKGATLKRVLKRFIEDEEIRRGYQYTDTPVLTKTELYKISGHLDHYRDKIFFVRTEDMKDEKEELFALRPMTCPHQFMIYNSKARSYRELPIRYAEIASLFRYEKSGELHGLVRIWQFTLADAHIICAPEQVEKEFADVIDLIKYVMKCLGFSEDEYWYRFSKWDPKNKEKYIDNPKAWNETQATMKKIIDSIGLKYTEADNEAAFYGPKLDVQMKNVFGKEDTIFTVQIDFAMPGRFGMTYMGNDGQEHVPMIIHRSSIGCLERVMAFLIEKYAGAFPVWMSPIQAKILPITERHVEYANKIKSELTNSGVRVELDDSHNTTDYKIRNATLEKMPYMIVVGDKEVENNTLAVRDRESGKTRYGLSVEDFVREIDEKVKNKV